MNRGSVWGISATRRIILLQMTVSSGHTWVKDPLRMQGRSVNFNEHKSSLITVTDYTVQLIFF